MCILDRYLNLLKIIIIDNNFCQGEFPKVHGKPQN